MPLYRLLSGIPAGSFGRWAFGVIVLTHLVAYNECGSVSSLVAVLIAALNSLLMGEYLNSECTKYLQINIQAFITKFFLR